MTLVYKVQNLQKLPNKLTLHKQQTCMKISSILIKSKRVGTSKLTKGKLLRYIEGGEQEGKIPLGPSKFKIQTWPLSLTRLLTLLFGSLEYLDTEE